MIDKKSNENDFKSHLKLTNPQIIMSKGVDNSGVFAENVITNRITREQLKKLIPPIDEKEHVTGANTDNFKIRLQLGNFGFEGYTNTTEDIEPYPLFELFDYRISGIVNPEGIAKLKFENKRVKNSLLW